MSERRILRFRDLFSRRDVLIIAGVGIANGASLALMVLLIRRIASAIAHPEDATEPMLVLLAILGVLALTQAVLKALEFTCPEAIGFRIVQKLRMRLYEHMAGMAPRQIQHRSRGSLILRLTGDLTMLRTWISRGLSRGAVALVSLIGCLVAVAWISPMTAIAITACFVTGSVASMLVGRRLQRVTAIVRRRRSLLTSNVDEQVNALSVVQVFGRTRGEVARLSRQNDDLTEPLLREARLRGFLRGLSSATGWMALTVAFAIGAYEVSLGRIDIGGVFAAIIATRLMQGYARSLGLAHDYWRRAEVSRRKLDDFLNSSSRTLADPTLAKLADTRGGIAFHGVSVEGALVDFTANIEAGRHVAIVGDSGSGKSTILQVVARMIACDAGEIHIGKQSLEECRIASVYRRIGMFGPDLPLMRGTLRRNLTYRNPDATDAEVAILIERCGLASLIDSFPDGLDHWVTEGGANLPAGTRQRIALARALLGNPPILLLDQPTAHLDATSSDMFRRLIAHHAGTVVMVTNDPRDIEIVDTVWTMDRGSCAYSETPNAYFARLRSQSGRPCLAASVS